jgi:hypothetical protein
MIKRSLELSFSARFGSGGGGPIKTDAFHNNTNDPYGSRVQVKKVRDLVLRSGHNRAFTTTW